MKGFWRMLAAWSFVLNLVWPGFSETPVSQNIKASLKIEVRVYNIARVPLKTLLEAEQEASRIFREAGVETIWWECSLPRADQENTSICQEPSSLTDFVLQVLPLSEAKEAKRLSLSKDSLGCAFPCPRDKPGCTGRLYHFRVERLSRQTGVSRKRLLGHAMAHELGHLLLGPSHSATGLMLGMWGPEELRQSARGRLLFTAQEAEVIRHSVLTRAMNQETLQNSRVETANRESPPSLRF